MENTSSLKPGKIYKYLSFDIAKIILQTNTLKFSNPTSFNDPFDCDVSIVDFDFSKPLNHKVRIAIEMLKSQFGDPLSSKPKAFWEQAFRGAQMDKINSSRITCFSLINDNMLMWAHYARHDGVCFEFDKFCSPRFFNLSDEKDISEGVVSYTANQRINYISEERKYAIYKLFFCKSEQWQYEREYRLVLLNDKAELQPFNKKFLSGVYFGLNCTNYQMEKVRKLLIQQEFTHVKTYKSRKSNLEIKFDEIRL